MIVMEISDDFIFNVDWYDVRAEDVAILRAILTSYPWWSLIVELWPPRAEGWVIA